jgi:hypothetical protein
VKAIQNVPDLVSSLGFASKSAFDRGTGFIVELRNHLAHGRSILNLADDAQRVVERIRDLGRLLGRVARLVAERDQVWRAFAATHIVHRHVLETVWSGPGAGSLPMPLPIHVITACNPFEQVLSAAENTRRNGALCELLSARRLEFQPVLGRSPDGSWSEPSFAIHGLSRVEACKVARLFGQRAVFELDNDESRVVTTDGEVRERRRRNE